MNQPQSNIVEAVRLNALHTRMRDVLNITLHAGQVQMARAYFVEGKKIIMSQWGRNCGKLLPLDTLIPTPDRGFVRMGEVEVGDLIFGSDGKPYRVLACSPVDENPVLYRVRFSDGSYIDACKDHQWETTTKLTRRSIKKNKGKMPNRSPLQSSQVLTTEGIKNTLKHNKEWNHSILCTLPVELPSHDLRLDPYVLGAWLGDGSSDSPSITGIDSQILDEIEKAGFQITKRKDPQSFGIVGLKRFLIELGLFRNKHIPHDYLWASREQRLSLLQGLMDTDGTCGKEGRCCFDNTNKRIADGVAHLLRSLGQRAVIRTKQGKLYGVNKRLVYRISFTPHGIMPFRLARKIARCSGRRIRNQRSIVAVEPIESRPGKCIQVDSPNSLYLAGEDFIPTHNSACDLYIACRAAMTRPNFEIYIILPQKEQAEDIYWQPKRLQTFAPPEYITGVSETNLTITFDTGSTIALHGAKNIDSLRGTKPNLVFYDESQGHVSEFHKEVMAPNLLGKNSALILTGTPPKIKDCFYYEFKSQVLGDLEVGDKSVAYFEFPTELNPIIDRNELEKMRLRLIKSGDISIWMREYLGKDCFVGRDSVFPTFSLIDHVKPRVFLKGLIEGDIDKLKWITVADPATTGVFAVLFAAYNPSTNQLFILDEIWENDRRLTDSHTMWKRIREKEKALYNGKWQRVYDESAVWFANEVSNNFKHESPNWRPTRKRKDKVEDGISKIKQLQNTQDSYFVASECVKFIWETENYVTDEEGYLPKNNDDLMDVQRYLVDALDVRSAERGSQQKDRVLRVEYQDVNKPSQTLTAVDSNWANKAMEAVETSDFDTYVSWEDW